VNGWRGRCDAANRVGPLVVEHGRPRRPGSRSSRVRRTRRPVPARGLGGVDREVADATRCECRPDRRKRRPRDAPLAVVHGHVERLRFRSIGRHSHRVASATSRSTPPSPRAGTWRRVRRTLEDREPGTSWTPVFDNEGSYSIGCVTIDPCQPVHRLVGTGENKTQRQCRLGDGSTVRTMAARAGRTWGSRARAHREDPRPPKDSNVVFVARRVRSGRRQ